MSSIFSLLAASTNSPSLVRSEGAIPGAEISALVISQVLTG